MATARADDWSEWDGRDTSVRDIERQLARLREASTTAGEAGNLRTSVMTHCAWVPPQWLDAAESTLEGMNDRHPSRTLLLVPEPGQADGLDAEIWLRCFESGGRQVCGEVIELRLRGSRAVAPASIVLPLAISDLPVFCRWRGEPDFGGRAWQELIGVADRVIVDSSEWNELRFAELVPAFERTAVSDIAWARTQPWRVELARYWPGIREQEIHLSGPPAETALLQGWLSSRLHRGVRRPEAAEELSVRLGGEQLPAPRGPSPTASDLLSAELDRFARDRIYQEAVAAAAAVSTGV
jgi:hypothetical protein